MSFTFSVVIPTRDRCKLLSRALASALDQTVPVEIVVIDDASQDETARVFRDAVDAFRGDPSKRLVYHRNAKSLGQSASMNVGIALSTGSWVKPLDDDDYLHPECLFEIRAALERVPSAVICSCRATDVDITGKVLGLRGPEGIASIWSVPQRNIHYAMLLELLPIGTPVQVAFSRAVAVECGGWDESLGVCNDVDLWLRLADHGDAVFVNKTLAYRTIWNGSTSVAQNVSGSERWKLNVRAKEAIRARISTSHVGAVPHPELIANYLRLHWSLILARQGHIRESLLLGAPALLRPQAWGFLGRARRAHKALGPALSRAGIDVMALPN